MIPTRGLSASRTHSWLRHSWVLPSRQTTHGFQGSDPPLLVGFIIVPHILGKHGYKIFISDTVGDTEFSVSNDIEHQLESADIGCQSDISPKICEITQYLAVLSSKNFVKTSNIVTFYTFGQRYFYLCHRY